MKYITNEPINEAEVRDRDPVLVARDVSAQSRPSETTPPTVIISGGQQKGVGSVNGTLLVILLIALMVMLFFGTDMHLKLKDFIKDSLDIATGGGNNTETEIFGDDVDNPQAGEGSTPVSITQGWVKWKTAAFITGLQNGSVHTGETYVEATSNGNQVRVHFDDKWDHVINHNIAYFNEIGELIMSESEFNVHDYKDDSDESWKNVFLRVVTIGLWWIQEYSGPVTSYAVCTIQNSAGYLRDAQCMYTGNIPQAEAAGVREMATKLRMGSFFNGSSEIKFGNWKIRCRDIYNGDHWWGSLDIANIDVTATKCRETEMDWPLLNALTLGQDQYFTTLSNARYRNLAMYRSTTTPQRQVAVARGMECIHFLNDVLKQALYDWYSDTDENKNQWRPYSIPGSIVPKVPMTNYYLRHPDQDPRTTLYSSLKSGEINPQAWLWECLNWYQSSQTDFRFGLYRNASGKTKCVLSGDSVGRKQDAAAELATIAYWIYLTQFSLGGKSLYEFSVTGRLWGDATWIGEAASTQQAVNAINASQSDGQSANVFSWLPQTQSEIEENGEHIPSLSDFDISPEILKHKCLPNDSVWIAQGAPSEYTHFNS